MKKQSLSCSKNNTKKNKKEKNKKLHDKLSDDFFRKFINVIAIPYYQSLGDTLGYRDGLWEFNEGNISAGPEYINEMIYDFFHLGGIVDINISRWKSSDDTIFYMATLDVLARGFENIDDFGRKIRLAYLGCTTLVINRDPGIITIDSLKIQETIEWNELPYNSKNIGNGAAMRSGCIGIFFLGKQNRKKLIKLAIESSRITHNSAIAILGSITSALFTAYALEKVPINLWPHKLIKLLSSEKIDNYIKKTRPPDFSFFQRDKHVFIGQWKKYIDLRFSGTEPRVNIRIMINPVQRFKYLKENFSKNCRVPGGCGDDAVIMAYDALLQSNGAIEKLILYAILHPGDSDTVGSIAFSWFGGFYHSLKYEQILSPLFQNLEYAGLLNKFFKIHSDNIATIFYDNVYYHKYIQNSENNK